MPSDRTQEARERAEATVDPHADCDRALQAALAAKEQLGERVSTLETALRKIQHWPFDVNSDAHIDLREIKDFAADALAEGDNRP